MIDRGRTRTEAARRVTENLLHSQVHLLGVVLNRMTTRRGGYYNNYYYYSSSKSNGTTHATATRWCSAEEK